MELRYLEIFCKVVECGSFSKAAEALYLTQPTISTHIKSLEQELSTRLLDRLGRRIAPTDEGEILYKYAREIVKSRDEARLALDQHCGRMRGVLSIGASTIPGEHILPAALSRFRSLYPEVYPEMRIADTRDIYSLILQGNAGVGVVGAELPDRNIGIKKLIDDELILIGPAGFKKDSLPRKELYEEQLLRRESGSGSRTSLEKAFRENGVDAGSLKFAGELGSTQALLGAVRSGMGLCFISRLAVREAIEGGQIKEIRVPGLRIKRGFYVINNRMKFNSLVTKTFIDFLLKEKDRLYPEGPR